MTPDQFLERFQREPARTFAKLVEDRSRLLEALKGARRVMSTEGENDLEEWEQTLANVEAAIVLAEGGAT